MGRNIGSLIMAKNSTNSTSSEDDDDDDDDYIDFYDDCGEKVGAFMECLPDCAAGCIFKSAISTDWENCTSIAAHLATATACVGASDEKCETEAAAMATCWAAQEAEAEADNEEIPCPATPPKANRYVAARVAAKLRGVA